MKLPKIEKQLTIRQKKKLLEKYDREFKKIKINQPFNYKEECEKCRKELEIKTVKGKSFGYCSDCNLITHSKVEEEENKYNEI